MDNSTIINKLVRKHGTRDPFKIAKGEGITVLYEELGTINGYYNKVLRMKQIHINHNLSEIEKHFTCAHELGHAMLHKDQNTNFLLSSTLMSVEKLEREADEFALDLLVSSDDIEKYMDYDTSEIKDVFGKCAMLMNRILEIHYKKGDAL